MSQSQFMYVMVKFVDDNRLCINEDQNMLYKCLVCINYSGRNVTDIILENKNGVMVVLNLIVFVQLIFSNCLILNICQRSCTAAL